MKTTPLLLTTAILGTAVGLGTGYFTRCAEATYPACYKQTVKAGFNTFDGIQYSLTDKKIDDAITLSFKSNVLCSYAVEVTLYSGGKADTQPETHLVNVENGLFNATFKAPENSKNSNEMFVSIIAPPEQPQHDFMIFDVLPKVVTSLTTMVKL